MHSDKNCNFAKCNLCEDWKTIYKDFIPIKKCVLTSNAQVIKINIQAKVIWTMVGKDILKATTFLWKIVSSIFKENSMISYYHVK